jgi:hypothetical protein
MVVQESTMGESGQVILVTRNGKLLKFDGSMRPARDHIPRSVLEGRELAFREAQDTARSEMARRRKRLGNLTPEQELNIETLLITTVNRISEMVTSVISKHRRMDHIMDGIQPPGIGSTGTALAAFDPFPAFVAYLLISNVIQIFLMPLIMVGQNLQGR